MEKYFYQRFCPPYKEEFIMSSKFLVMCLSLALIMSGCASVTKSVLTGTSAGIALGGASGALIDKKNPAQSALTSALIMGVIGGIAGYFTHDALESRDAEVRKETLFNLDHYGVSGFPNDVRSNRSDVEDKKSKPRYLRYFENTGGGK